MFDDAAEREDVIEDVLADNNRAQIPQVFRYGIQFRPDRLSSSISADQGHRRGVQFFYLRPDCTIRDVLSRVRGGIVISAARAKIDTTARVVFLREQDAMRYAAFAQTEPALIKELGLNAILAHLDTDTYPESPIVVGATVQGWTRCISIGGFGPDWMNSMEAKAEMSNIWHLHLRRIWDRPEDRLEDAWVPPSGNLFICFTTIFAAVQFRNAVKDYLDVYKESDPCNKDVTASDAEVGWPARGVCESILDVWWLRRTDEGDDSLEEASFSPSSSSSSSETASSDEW